MHALVGLDQHRAASIPTPSRSRDGDLGRVRDTPARRECAHLQFTGFFKSLGIGCGRERRSRDLEPAPHGETEQERQDQRDEGLQDREEADDEGDEIAVLEKTLAERVFAKAFRGQR
jgi:hypothetical protein